MKFIEKIRLSWRGTALAVGTLTFVLALSSTEVLAGPPETSVPGKLHVALNGDMPMTGLDADRKLIGTDGGPIVIVAERLRPGGWPHMPA